MGAIKDEVGDPASAKVRRGRRSNGTGIPPLPMEWMDPLSWRLPSGQALAEFAFADRVSGAADDESAEIKKEAGSG